MIKVKVLSLYRRIKTIKELQTNNMIRDREVRLIASNGDQLGIVSGYEAKRLAEEEGLDLVKISPTANPPVCKIMDYGKFRYEQQKREKEGKKNQNAVGLKEVWLSATIDIGDLKRLAQQAAKFVLEGNRVKASIRLKGRQQAYPERAVEIIKEFIQLAGESVQVEKAPMQEGRNIYTILAPLPNKKQ